jgi:SAM-dependent methyltransferase
MRCSALRHPLAHNLDLDDPATTIRRREILRRKPFLRRIYAEWYDRIAKELPPSGGPILEIGSGAGFFGHFMPQLITSELLPVPGVDVSLDATRVPFRGSSLDGIVMTNVLHHIPRVRDFFHEAARCVKVGGAIVMIEPWVTRWSRFVYTRFHDEPFEPEAATWEFHSGGPVSSANGALAWVIFHRDATAFATQHPEWNVRKIQRLMPLRYLLSGGLARRALVPSVTFDACKLIEGLFEPWIDKWAMFALIVLERRGGTQGLRSYARIKNIGDPGSLSDPAGPKSAIRW